AAPGAPLVHDAAPGHVILDFHHSDAAAVEAAFAEAAHVTRLKIRNSRVVVCRMEPRSAIGDYDPESERWPARLGCQGVFNMRRFLLTPLKAPVESIRVLTGNVGGSFGMKASCYPEYPAILYASRLLARPVAAGERCALLHLRLLPGAGEDHPARIEGLWRGRVCRGAAIGDKRAGGSA